jgi:hypothetical protein
MFGSEHQIARKTAPLDAFSRVYADFISDLKFGSEHQIQQASAPFAQSERLTMDRRLARSL